MLPSDAARIDWPNLILDATYRRPPFDPASTTEKGFRDRLILESVAQLVQDSPATRTICRVVFATGDKLLFDAANARFADRTNVHVLGALEELRSLIATLASDVSEAFIAGVLPLAAALFFTEGADECVFRKEKVRQRVLRELSDRLSEIPPGATSRTHDRWTVGKTRFISKERQRVQFEEP